MLYEVITDVRGALDHGRGQRVSEDLAAVDREHFERLKRVERLGGRDPDSGPPQDVGEFEDARLHGPASPPTLCVLLGSPRARRQRGLRIGMPALGRLREQLVELALGLPNVPFVFEDDVERPGDDFAVQLHSYNFV